MSIPHKKCYRSDTALGRAERFVKNPEHNRSQATLERAKLIIRQRLSQRWKASRIELAVAKPTRWDTDAQVPDLIQRHPQTLFMSLSSNGSNDEFGHNEEIRQLARRGILPDWAKDEIGDRRAAKFEHFRRLERQIANGLRSDGAAFRETHESVAAILEEIQRDLKADRLADREWHRTIPVIKGRPAPIMGLRRRGMKQPLLPMSKETFRLKFSNLLQDKTDKKEPQLAIPIPSLARSAEMFKATYINLTDKSIKPKNGNFQKLVGKRKRNIFGKFYFKDKDGERQSVDWRDGPTRLAWENVSPLILAKPNSGSRSMLADMADRDGALRKTIWLGLPGLAWGLGKFYLRYVKDKKTKKGEFVYPLWAKLESKAALRCLVILTERMSRIKITTASGVRYEVPPSFIKRTLKLINWLNDKYPWYRIHKHHKSRDDLSGRWVGDFITDVMARLYPDIDRDTVGRWIDLVLGAQNDLR